MPQPEKQHGMPVTVPGIVKQAQGGIDKSRVAQDFGRAVHAYSGAARLQQMVARQLVVRAKEHFPHGSLLLDAGCGTGFIAQEAKAQQAGWQLVQLDIAGPMCRSAADAYPEHPAMQADMERLPLSDASLTWVVSSLAWQWLPNPQQGWQELARILRPGGKALIATLGPGSMQELRTAFILAEGEGVPRFHSYPPVRQHAEQIQSAGLQPVEVNDETIVMHHASLHAALQSIRAIGAAYKGHAVTAPLTPGTLQRASRHYTTLYATEAGLPVSWDIQWIVVKKSTAC